MKIETINHKGHEVHEVNNGILRKYPLCSFVSLVSFVVPGLLPTQDETP